MNNIEWKEGVVFLADTLQYKITDGKCYYYSDANESWCSSAHDAEQLLGRESFQLNEIRTGDFIPASELDTEQKYDEVVEVFGLFGFERVKDSLSYSRLSVGATHYLASDDYGIDSVSNDIAFKNYCKGRQLTYHQIIAIGKLKRMMLERESIERKSSYCRCKQVDFGESKLPKFNAETPMTEVKEPKKYKPVVAQVMVDLMERMEVGIKTYGEALRPSNGRDALQDAYEEALDLACYLKQAMIERDQADD